VCVFVCVCIYIYIYRICILSKLQHGFVYWFYFKLATCFGLCFGPSSGHGIYRVVHKFLRDFRPLRYSSLDGHAEGEHINRGRETPSFCRTLQVLDMSTLGDEAQMSQLTQFWQIPRHRMLSYSLSTPCFVTIVP
jgi:hypothetical protein